MLERLQHRLEIFRSHRVARRQPISVLLRFAKAEIINGWFGYPFLYAHDFGVVLIVQKGHHATRGHYFFGLHEFQDESFAINFLRKGELFIDIGANLGVFSIMVAATTDARVIALEPSPSSSHVFKQHMALNNLVDRVTLVEACAGEAASDVFIKNSVDQDNFVFLERNNSQPDHVKIPMVKIDAVIDADVPCLMKMDVEGFEMQALKGATRLLKNQNLQAIIIEIAGLSHRFGINPDDIHKFIADFGFRPVTYDPLTRRLTSTAPNSPLANNTIYVRDLDVARERLSKAPRRSLHTLSL